MGMAWREKGHLLHFEIKKLIIPAFYPVLDTALTMTYFHLSVNEISTVRFDVQIKNMFFEICIKMSNSFNIYFLKNPFYDQV